MVKIKLTTAWSYQGKWHEAGTVLEVLPVTAVNLVSRGVAEEVGEKADKAEKGSPKKPQLKKNVKASDKKGDNIPELD